MLLTGDVMDVLPTLEADSFDAMLTDPPYGIGFMGKEWDTPGAFVERKPVRANSWDKVGGNHNPTSPLDRSRTRLSENEKYQGFVTAWATEALRVLKPGAFALVFGGTRTFHRLAVALEDAGFEMRDTLMWVYGCVTPDTLALTRRGWLAYDQLTVNDELCQWNPATGHLSWAKPERINTWQFDGHLVNLKNRHTDQLLTPNHNVYARVRRHSRNATGQEYERLNAGDLRPSWIVDLPLAGTLEGGIEIDADYAYLVGWWLTDAWRHGDGKAVMFSQSKPATLARLRAALAPHDPSEYVKRGRKATHSDEYTFYVTGPLADRLIAEYPDRRLDWRTLGWDLEARHALLRGLIDGDGTECDGQHGGTFWSRDPDRRAVFLALCVSVGWRCYDDPGKGAVYYHRERTTTQLQKRHRDAAPSVPYQGVVWCPTMPLGTWVAMRNGRPFITGNSGFPKSHDVSKGIDKLAGAERKVIGSNPNHRAVSGVNYEGIYAGGNTGAAHITAPATPEAERWQGYGTSLKPAYEPVLLVRKPTPLTYAQNAIEHGTGALNIDASRVGTMEDTRRPSAGGNNGLLGTSTFKIRERKVEDQPLRSGRWPANLIHDGSDEVVDLFPQTEPGGYPAKRKGVGYHGGASGQSGLTAAKTDAGSAARFFYTAKANSKERNAGLAERNPHPTIKPLALTRYLATLLLPPERDTPRRLLVPFAGSGSEMIGARQAGWDEVVGIEREAEYVSIAEQRIAHWLKEAA